MLPGAIACDHDDLGGHVRYDLNGFEGGFGNDLARRLSGMVSGVISKSEGTSFVIAQTIPRVASMISARLS
eukprot:3630666-Rhodomonas_salina.1